MKKILLAAILFQCLLSHSQNKVAQHVRELQIAKTIFRPVSVLSVSNETPNQDIQKVVDNATLATLQQAKVTEIVAAKSENLALQIPYDNQLLTVLLYRVNPLAEGFHVDTNRAKNVAYESGVYYRGIINGDYNSTASFNFFNGEFNGVFSSSTYGNIVVGKLDKANNVNDYIVYSDAKMKVLNQFDCHVKDDVDLDMEHPEQHRNGQETQSTRCVTMYFEIDYNLYQSNGSNVTTTTNWMTSVFNNVQTLYNNDGISIALKSMYIWTDPDPYEGIGTSSGDYLYAFNANRPVFDGDLGQLLGIDPGGLGGVAVTINGLCTQNNFSYSDVNFSYATVPAYSWTINVITHEFGHLMGSRHTHACAWNGNNTAIDGCGQQAGYSEGTCAQGPIPTFSVKGTIMSYCHLISGVGINLANGFGPQPAAAVLAAVNNGTCLSFDCVNTCINTVTGIYTTNVTTNSVAFTWTDSNPSQTSWEVSVTPFSSTAITWVTVNTNSYSVSGLNANAYYKIRVRPLCSGLTATSRVQIFATMATNPCNFSFLDTGGGGNYTNNESWVRTIFPTGNGLKIRATFSSFNLELDYDYLYIYDGPDESYPEITGGLTGTTVPGQFNATDVSGALTFKFYSDQGVVASGWNAAITCTGTLGLESNNFIDFSYAPNPTNGNVNIVSNTAIKEITVYNVMGQLLYKNTLNDLNPQVDLSSYAKGTYFFKLKFEGDQQANFKIIRD